MTHSRLSSRVAGRLPLGDLRWLAALVVVEVLLLAGYFAASTAEPTSIRYLLYPFVWINVAAWAIVRTDPPPASLRNRRIAAAVAAGYLLVLSYTGGLVGLGGGPVTGLRVITLSIPPGWGPAVLYNGSALTLNLVPYKLFGYVGLAFLVYVTVLDAAGSAIGGVLGLLSCVSCSWPVIASLVAGVAGSSSQIAAATLSYSLDLSTAAFVLAMALLYYRPGFGS